jgi:hypothetical protein
VRATAVTMCLTNLRDESTEIPRIDVKYNSGNISRYFVRAAQNHPPHYPWSLPSPSQDKMNDCGHREDGGENNVCWK